MNRAALAVALAATALARPALGQDERTAPTPRPDWLAGTPPAGWSELPGLARKVGSGLLQSAPFGDPGGRGGALAFVERGSGAFYLSWLESDRPAPTPVEAVRGALDRLRESRLVSGPDARSTEELGYDESLKENLAEARLEWRHLSNETLSLVRAFVWLSSEGKPRLAAAECVLSASAEKSPSPAERACRDALASVAVKVPPTARGALAALPASRPASGTEPFAPVEDRAAAPVENPPTVGPIAPDAEGRVLYRGPEAEEKRSGMNPWLVAIGAALIALAAYVTIQRRLRPETGADRSRHSATSIPPAGTGPGPETTHER